MTLINDHFQNFKGYQIPRAQLVIADIPYNVGVNAYGSNPQWYIDGDNKNGQSEFAGKSFFDTDENFKPSEFMHFCNRLMVKEPKESGKAPCMIVFCSFEQQWSLIRTCEAIRNKALHKSCFQKKLFSAGAKSQYESCRKLRICTFIL